MARRQEAGTRRNGGHRTATTASAAAASRGVPAAEQLVGCYDASGAYHELAVPPDHYELAPGITWGSMRSFGTSAFWAMCCWIAERKGECQPKRMGETFAEQVAACLLGGYGMPAEAGWAAYRRLRDADLLRGQHDAMVLERALSKLLSVRGRIVRYRFPRQKARYLAETLRLVGDGPPAGMTKGREIRDWLLRCPGVGHKTASWIVRDWVGADDVAILDVHVVRACIAMGVFPKDAQPMRDYLALEQRFIGYARALSARPSVLDAVMWRTMKDMRTLSRAA